MAKINEQHVRELLAKVLSGEVDQTSVAALIDGRCRVLEPELFYGKVHHLDFAWPDGGRGSLQLTSPDGLRGIPGSRTLGLRSGVLVVDDAQAEKLAEIRMDRGAFWIRSLDPGKPVSLTREVLATEVLEAGDILDVAGIKLEIDEVVPTESELAKRADESHLYIVGNREATLGQFQVLLAKLLEGGIEDRIVAGVLGGFRQRREIKDCLHMLNLAVRYRTPGGRSCSTLLPPNRRLTVGRKGDIRIDNPNLADEHLELVHDFEALKVRSSGQALLTHRIVEEEPLDLNEILLIGGFSCSWRLEPVPYRGETDEEKSIIFDLNAIAQANQVGQSGPTDP